MSASRWPPIQAAAGTASPRANASRSAWMRLSPCFLVGSARRIAGLFRSIGWGLCHGVASTLVAGPGSGHHLVGMNQRASTKTQRRRLSRTSLEPGTEAVARASIPTLRSRAEPRAGANGSRARVNVAS
jgi:hypothetical protein